MKIVVAFSSFLALILFFLLTRGLNASWPQYAPVNPNQDAGFSVEQLEEMGDGEPATLPQDKGPQDKAAKPLDLKPVTVAQKVTEKYEGPTNYGRFTNISEGQSKTILGSEFLRVRIETDKELGGFHLELKPKTGAGTPGFFGLFVLKEQGEWRFFQSKGEERIKVETGAVVTPGKDGTKFVVTIDVPVTEIAKALKDSGSERIAQLHVKTGQQHEKFILNENGNIPSTAVLWQPMVRR